MRNALLLLPVLLLAACGPTAASRPSEPQPANPQVTLAGPTTITAAGTQVWTASTSAGVTSVHFYLDGTDLGVDNAAPFQVSPSFSAAQNGTHTLKAVATTAQGSQGSTAITLNVNIAGTTPQPQPGQIFIPAAGAAVGSGDGTQFGTVYVSPNQQEVDFMVLLNEVRTKGTLNGVDVRAGTCLAGVQPGTLKPLTYNGVLAYPARKHSVYLGTWGYEGHYENNPSHPAFYGQNPSDRIYRAYNELGVSTANIATGGEIVNANLDAGHWSISSFLNSPAHCQILAQAEIKSIGVGFYTNNQPHHSNGSLTVYPNNWTVLFGR